MLTSREERVAEERYVLPADQVRRVRAVLYLSGVPAADLDDAVQDVQLRLLEQPAASITNASAWAYTVATRIAIDRHRRATTRDTVARRLRSLTSAAHHDPDLALANSVRVAISKLEPDLRAAVVLRYYADLTVDEIAAMVGVPAGTIKSRLHRAAALLRPALQEKP